jgi:hypothetical protein
VSPIWNSDGSRSTPASSIAYSGDPSEQLLEDHDAFEPRRVRADAEVNTVTEAEVTLHAPLDVETVGVGELGLVAIRGQVQQEDPLPGVHRLPGDVGVLNKRARAELQRQVHPQDLFKRGRNAAEILGKRGALVGVCRERAHSSADHLRQRLHAADHHRGELRRDLDLAERTAFDLNRAQGGHDR